MYPGRSIGLEIATTSRTFARQAFSRFFRMRFFRCRGRGTACSANASARFGPPASSCNVPPHVHVIPVARPKSSFAFAARAAWASEICFTVSASTSHPLHRGFAVSGPKMTSTGKFSGHVPSSGSSFRPLRRSRTPSSRPAMYPKMQAAMAMRRSDSGGILPGLDDRRKSYRVCFSRKTRARTQRETRTAPSPGGMCPSDR